MEIELNDADLVRQIGLKDREAEAELFRRMAPRIHLYGLSGQSAGSGKGIGLEVQTVAK